ncbi:MAG: radical SAM family heme chaperone HemW [Bacteroidales bacterium]|nr:radical SAM family heme chaperone HemW [Bacteroidales bacterium]
MAGIYVHIPFCRQKCHYCNFFSVATKRGRDTFTDALLREAEMQRDYLAGEKIETIYFGGGTPSLLKTEDLTRIFDVIYSLFPVDNEAEITLETNPDDLTEEKAREWKDTPVNRLSIGIQSFFDDDLAYLNRVHNAAQARQSVENAREAGFRNLTIDLIYGIPTLTKKKWRQNLELFFSLDIPHLSAYALTVEEKTPLWALIRKGRYTPVDERQSVAHFRTLLEIAAKNGFIHYEISNFSRPGFYSRHNSLYWLGGHYLGLGPSAHSYNGVSRQWNVSRLDGYLQLSGHQTVVEEKEILTPEQRYNEYVMTSLRTVWGCDTEHIANVFGEARRDFFLENARPFTEKNHLYQEGTRFFLTDEGKLFADGIAAALFTEVEP